MNLNLGLRFWVFMLLLAVFPAQADDFDSVLTEDRNVFLQGVDGDKRAVRNAVNRFRSLSRNNPMDPVYLAYYGASITLQGRDAAKGFEKQRFTEDGLAKIDRALKLLSEVKHYPSTRRLDTLLVAANAFVYIPSFFNRYDRGKGLLQEILSHEDFNGMAAGFKAATYFTAALVARGDGDESEYRRLLALIVATDPQGRDGRAASGLLEQ
jgi:hypothetical protein